MLVERGWPKADATAFHALVDRHPCILLSDSDAVADTTEGQTPKPVHEGRVAAEG